MIFTQTPFLHSEALISLFVSAFLRFCFMNNETVVCRINGLPWSTTSLSAFKHSMSLMKIYQDQFLFDTLLLSSAYEAFSSFSVTFYTKRSLSFIYFATDSDVLRLPRNLFAVKFEVRLNQAYYRTPPTVKTQSVIQALRKISFFSPHPPPLLLVNCSEALYIFFGASTYKMVLVTAVHCDFHSFSGAGGLAKCLREPLPIHPNLLSDRCLISMTVSCS